MDKLIFVSCGQKTEEEKTVGLALKGVVDSTPGFKAFYAEHGQDLGTLVDVILRNASTCAGVIIVIHKRESVFPDSKQPNRASVWVSQELAILKQRFHSEGNDFPVLAFKDPEVNFEGLIGGLHLNPRPIPVELADLKLQTREWLNATTFPPGSDRIFVDKWDKLPDESRFSLHVLIEEGEVNVREEQIRIAMRERYGCEKNEPSDITRDAHTFLHQAGFITFEYNIEIGHGWSLHPTWASRVKRAVADWFPTSKWSSRRT